MRIESSFTFDGKMLITYGSRDIMSETDLNTGITTVFLAGVLKATWQNMTIDEFCKRQKLIIEKGQIVQDHKPELK